jgi:hypothetical protein
MAIELTEAQRNRQLDKLIQRRRLQADIDRHTLALKTFCAREESIVFCVHDSADEVLCTLSELMGIQETIYLGRCSNPVIRWRGGMGTTIIGHREANYSAMICLCVGVAAGISKLEEDAIAHCKDIQGKCRDAAEVRNIHNHSAGPVGHPIQIFYACVTGNERWLKRVQGEPWHLGDLDEDWVESYESELAELSDVALFDLLKKRPRLQ